MSPQEYLEYCQSQSTETLFDLLKMINSYKFKALSAQNKAEKAQEFKAFQYWSRYVGKYTFQAMCISRELEKRFEL